MNKANQTVCRERKELSVGETSVEAIEALLETRGLTYDGSIHDLVQDETTKLWSIYHRRRPTDKTMKRPISRESREPYSNGYGKDRRKIVVTLLPHELIETRLKGTRRRYAISWDDLHQYLVRRSALAAIRVKQTERAAKRKARKAAKR